MIYFATTLGNLKRAIDSYINILGENAPIVREVQGNKVDDLLALDWVIIEQNPNGLFIIGEECDDKTKGTNAVRIS